MSTFWFVIQERSEKEPLKLPHQPPNPPGLRRRQLPSTEPHPNDYERRELFEMTLAGVDVAPELIDELVTITGARDGRPSFTFSDIQTRLIPAAVARAYPDRALTADDLLIAAAELEPTPVIREATE